MGAIHPYSDFCGNPKCRPCLITYGRGYTAEMAIAEGEERRLASKIKNKLGVPPLPDTGTRKLKPSEAKAAQSRPKDGDLPFEAEAKSVDVETIPELADCLPDLCARYRELHIEIAEREKEKKELGADIKALLDAVGQTAVHGTNWVAVRSRDTEKESLSKEKLLENGVGMDVIEASIEKTPVSGYVQVKAWKP